MAGDDTELIARARTGDAEAIEALLAAYEPQIYRFALRMCGNEDDARDTLQETMIAAFRGLSGFRGEARLSTWLYQIARSFCIKQRRPGASVRADGEVPEGAAAPEDCEPDAKAHAREIGAALAAALAALAPAYREAVVLRDVEGLSADEAAEVAGVEVGALKSRLHRGRMELRANLAALLGDDAAGPTPCPELAQELSAYVDAEIDQAACAQVEAHLASCPRCAGACETLQRTVSLCRRIPGGEVPPPVRAAVRRALRTAIGA
ncbi:MAG TPA: sigma-70 family RNA polymerase sigma factor [Kofleriaceae bacterium]|nr:sigma-70 family RNA polymerase sigma factor [Kofleriaceae bacterium]